MGETHDEGAEPEYASFGLLVRFGRRSSKTRLADAIDLRRLSDSTCTQEGGEPCVLPIGNNTYREKNPVHRAHSPPFQTRSADEPHVMDGAGRPRGRIALRAKSEFSLVSVEIRVAAVLPYQTITLNQQARRIFNPETVVRETV